MTPTSVLSVLGEEIDDPETETFLLFAQSRPSQDLGYVNKSKITLELSVAGRDLLIQQSPTLLSSNRDGGTTGAVLWRITPFFVDWLLNSFLMSALDTDSTVLELGCGISGLLALFLGPKIGRFIATDQGYVFKLLRTNLDENAPKRKESLQSGKRKRQQKAMNGSSSEGNIELIALDWETGVASGLAEQDSSKNGFDLVIGCDCIYNEALIQPFVRTCAELCRIRSNMNDKPTICIIAQQLRSDAVFSEWLSAFCERFRAWRVPDSLLTSELKDGSGYCVHVGIVKESQEA